MFFDHMQLKVLLPEGPVVTQGARESAIFPATFVNRVSRKVGSVSVTASTDVTAESLVCKQMVCDYLWC